MDAKCYITSCEILDTSINIVNELIYGINCETVKYCNFARYYIEADLEQLEIINNGEEDIDIPDPIEPPIDPDIPDPIDPDIPIEPPIIIGTIDYEFYYSNYQCVIVTESSTTTTTTTTVEECEINPTIDEIVFTTTTSTSTTTTTTTTV